MTLQELGQSLREQREAAGISLQEISAKMKLSVRILKSIEEGSMVGMPHAVYTKRFIRSLGNVIGYDAEDLNAKLDIIFPPESLDEESRADPGRLDRMASMDYGGLKRILGLLVILAAFAGLAAGGWFVAKNYGDDIWRLIRQPFSAMSTPAANRTEGHGIPVAGIDSPASGMTSSSSGMQQQAPPPQSHYQSEPASPVYPLAAPPSPAGAPAGMESGFTPQGAGQPAPGNASMPPSPGASSMTAAPPPVAGTMNQVLIMAKEECWISSRADGATGREYNLRPGESFVLTYTNSLELSLGNAGGVTLVHNGRNMGRPGVGRQRVDLHFPMPGN